MKKNLPLHIDVLHKRTVKAIADALDELTLLKNETLHEVNKKQYTHAWQFLYQVKGMIEDTKE